MIDLSEHLDEQQLSEYEDYIQVLNESIENGRDHEARIRAFRKIIKPVKIDHCIPFSDPYDLDQPLKVFHPSSRFIAELMHGGIHPPLSAHIAQKRLIVAKSGASAVVSKVDAEEWKSLNAPISAEYVIDNRLCHTETEGPLTYEQAIEYAIVVSLPVSVWGREHNQRQFYIIEKTDLPNRDLRNSWEFATEGIAA